MRVRCLAYRLLPLLLYRLCAAMNSAAEAISVTSRVIAAWRALL